MPDVTENTAPAAEPNAEALAPSWMKRYSTVRLEEESPDVAATFGAAFRRENLAYNVIDAMTSDKPGAVDMNYSFQENKTDLLKDIPEEYHMDIAMEASLADANYTRDKVISDMNDRDIIAQSGFTGISASVAAALFSPENFIPFVNGAGWVNKSSRAVNALRLGTATAALSGGSETILAAHDYTKDGEDILYAASFGFILGGAVGAVLKPGARAATAADDVAEGAGDTGTVTRPSRNTTDDGAEIADTFGPPAPVTRSRDVLVSSGLKAERRGGPINIAARTEAEEVLESFPNLDTVSNAKRKRTQEDVSRAMSRLDPEENVGSDVAEQLEKAYKFSGIEPRGTKTLTVEDRVAGSWDQLQGDFKAASAKLRADMDNELVDDVIRGADDSVGAMRNRNVEAQIVDTTGSEDDIIDAANNWEKTERISGRLAEDMTNTVAKANKITASDYTRLINHPSSVVRKLAKDLLEGGTGTLGRTNTAAMYKDMYERRILSTGIIPLNEQAAQWAKAAGYNMFKRTFHTEARTKFDRMVREVMEGRTTGVESRITDPHVIEAADRLDDMFAEALNIGKKAGVESLQEIPTRKGYVPLQWQGTSILRMGSAPARQLISRGYQSVGIPKEMADEIAAAVVKRALDGTAGVDTNIAGLLKKDQRGQLRTALERMGIEDGQINGMMRVLDAKEAKSGPSFTKGRTKIDLNISSGGYSLLDLVDNDLNAIASKYAREISGRAGMARKGFTNETIWNTWKSAALKDNARVKTLGDGDDGLSEHLDDIKSYFTATPIAGGINKNARRFQQLATITSLGMVGAAQLAELGTVVGRLGLKSAAKNLPAVGDIVTLARKANKSNTVIDELRPILGDFDYDHLLFRPDVVIDDRISGSVDIGTFGKLLDNGLGKGSVALGYASGMNTVRHFEHRMAAKMMINKFADLAVHPEKIAKSLARMEDIGIDAAYLEKIIKQINKGVANGDTVFDANGTLSKLGIQKWPEDVAEQFAIGINRHTSQVVQRQLSGETSNWMHKTVGSLLTQFRHFPIVAFEKQLLRNIKYHDQATMSTLLYGFAVSYGVQNIKAAMSSRELEQEDLIKQSVNYMAMVSIAPEVGTLLNQMGLAPDALNTRKLGHTGSRADEFDIVDFIPAAGQVNKLFKAASLPGKLMSGDASNADIRAAWMALPLSTTLANKLLMEAMLED